MINLKIARIKSNLTQQQLSDITGIKLINIGSYERGSRTPTVKNLVILADALKVTTDFLLDRE